MEIDYDHSCETRIEIAWQQDSNGKNRVINKYTM
jgi:hypothetical protein